MNPVLRFAFLYAGVLAISFSLAIIGFAALSPYVLPPLIVIAAYLSHGRGVGAVIGMAAILVLINLGVTLGFAGVTALPALWWEFLASPFLLTLWMASSLLIPVLLIAGGVWLRHINEKRKGSAP
mgnify:CR=1 FL=1